MYDHVNLTELKRMADLCETVSKKPLRIGELYFDMRTYGTLKSCGYAACLIGSYVTLTGRRLSEVLSQNFFQIPRAVFRFLFSHHSSHPDKVFQTQIVHAINAVGLFKDQAIARLRKYIRYVERKQLLWQEHDELMQLCRKDRRLRLMAPKHTRQCRVVAEIEP